MLQILTLGIVLTICCSSTSATDPETPPAPESVSAPEHAPESATAPESAPIHSTLPLKLDRLEEYVKDMDAKNGWKAEFDRLGPPQTQLRNWTHALLPQNLVKHRYPPPEDNLLTYDDTRVILPRLRDDNFSDFINANWVNSASERRRYIATQCPLPSTISDFYRMVWHYNVHEVVMLANEHDIEKNKCARYFPDVNATYGDIHITLQRKTEFPNVVVRIYALRRGFAQRVFVHHHFLAWPDMGVPSDPQLLLSLIRLYRSSDTFTKAWPIIVHCSAGVGRTGTFVLTDAMYDRALNSDTVDFLRRLASIRTQRISLVEKPEQYALAHKVILQAYKEGLFERTRPQPPFNPFGHALAPSRVIMVDPMATVQEIVIRIPVTSGNQNCSTKI